MSYIPEGPKEACEEILFSFDKNGNLDVKEVFVKAKTNDELCLKLDKIKELSPNTIVLNGSVRKFTTVLKSVDD